MIGLPIENDPQDKAEVTSIGEGSEIFPFTTIYEGAAIGKNVTIDECSRIGHKTKVGEQTKIVYGAKIYDNVTIGRNSIVGGFSCDRSKIGNNTTMMGTLVHKYLHHAIDTWDKELGPDEPTPVIENNAIVAFNSTIIGGVIVGEGAYVGAGTVVTENVPPNTKVYCRCELVSSRRD